MDYFDTFEWEVKGAFGAPSTDITEIIEWEAKGGMAVTTQGDYQTTVEWDAKGSFGTPKAFIFIDLR